MDHTVAEKRHAVGDIAGEADLVGDQNHGHSFVGQHAQGVQHLANQLRVQRGGDLVKQHVVGRHGQGACDRHALQLPARELAGKYFELVLQAHVAELGDGDFFGLRGGHATYFARGQHHVL